jgi:hypothetical protein
MQSVMLKMTLSDCMQWSEMRLADKEEACITLWRTIFCMLLSEHTKHSEIIFFQWEQIYWLFSMTEQQIDS